MIAEEERGNYSSVRRKGKQPPGNARAISSTICSIRAAESPPKEERGKGKRSCQKEGGSLTCPSCRPDREREGDRHFLLDEPFGKKKGKKKGGELAGEESHLRLPLRRRLESRLLKKEKDTVGGKVLPAS